MTWTPGGRDRTVSTMRPRAAGVALLCLAASPGCDAGDVCTLEALDPGFHLAIRNGDESPLPQGAYRVAVLYDDLERGLECHVVPGDVNCDPPINGDGEWLALLPASTRSDDTEALELTILVEQGGAATGPEEVDVTVFRDSEEIARDRFSPLYERQTETPECGDALGSRDSLDLN